MTSKNQPIMIIGGGVIGLSIAVELLSRGCAVEVLDRGPVAGYATAAAAGMLAPVSEAELEDHVVLPMAFDSLERYPEFVRRIEELAGRSCGYRTDGTLWVAVTRDDEAELEHIHRTLSEKIEGMPARWLTREEVFDREPHISGRVLRGLLVERDLQLDPRALITVLEHAVTRQGGTVIRDATVRRIVTREDRVEGLELTLGDEPESRPCRQVVLAAGAWSQRDIETPLEDLGLRPVKGQLIRLGGPCLLRHVVRHPDVYLVPRETGELLVGATMEEVGFDAAVTAGAVHDILRRAWQLLPGLYDLELDEISVGFRPVSRDNRPVIGPTPVEGLHLAVGHGRQGVLLAPATAHLVAEAIVTGVSPESMRPFAVSRFSPTPTGGDRMAHR